MPHGIASKKTKKKKARGHLLLPYYPQGQSHFKKWHSMNLCRIVSNQGWPFLRLIIFYMHINTDSEYIFKVRFMIIIPWIFIQFWSTAPLLQAELYAKYSSKQQAKSIAPKWDLQGNFRCQKGLEPHPVSLPGSLWWRSSWPLRLAPQQALLLLCDWTHVLT